MFSKDLPKTVVFGAAGFLGSTFLSVYKQMFPNCIGADLNTMNGNLLKFDLLDPNLASFELAKNKYKDALILSAITEIDSCERDPELTRKVNVDGVLKLVGQLKEEGVRPIFFSTDYVFDGKKGDYSDDAPVSPITEYGKQKAEIESKIEEITKDNYLIVRLSKVFSLQKGDGTLLDEMARDLISGKTIKAAYDQIFCPTYVLDVVKAVIFLQANGDKGIVNVCAPEKWSRYDLAVALAKTMGVNSDKIIKVSLDKIGFRSKRPKNTSLIAKRLCENKMISFVPITKCVEATANNWKDG